MQKRSAALTIYKASAGSGKTYNLVKSYLLLALDSRNETYRHILAITFTKKATAEMRDRILRELQILSHDPEKSNHTVDLTAQLNISSEELKRRSRILLITLMHDYSNFSISTIDQFFQRIFRSVAYELDLTGGFAIELDENYLLERAVDQFLEKAQPGTEQYKLLQRYVNEEILGNDKKQNIKQDILKYTVKMMIDEIKDFVTSQDRNHLFSSIKDVEKECSQWKKEFESWNEASKNEYHSIIEKHHLNDIIKTKGNPVLKMVTLEIKTLNSSKLSEIIYDYGSEELYNKIFYKKTKGDYSKAFHELETFFNQNRLKLITLLPKYLFAKEVLPKLWHLQFFIYIWNEISDIAQRENIFLLSNTPLLLRQVSEQTNTPFIYERMGQWYHHFMIDEFQDTSRYQWANLFPFLENNIAEFNPNQIRHSISNLIIGDVKQAIYRFRGGDWRLLNNEVKNQFANHNIEELTLNVNYRSHSTIVEFNNFFFNFLTNQHLQLDFVEYDRNEKKRLEELLKAIYSDCKQKAKNEKEGYVSIELIPPKSDENEDYVDQTLKKVETTLKKLFEAGAKPRDIVILTRKRESGKKIIDYLLSKEEFKSLPIATDDVLTIGQSNVVMAIINILNFLLQPCDYHKAKAAWQIASALDQTADFSFTELDNNPIACRIAENAELWNRMSLLDAVIDIIQEFNFNHIHKEHIYLQQFLWLIFEFTQNQIPHIQSFLNFWNERGIKNKVPPPSNTDALRVMTIHKSKGLEFQHVIIPFLDGSIKKNNEQVWIRGVDPKPEMPFLVSLSSKAALTSYSRNYYEEMFNYLIDTINQVYVALTRAKETLHIFTKEADKSNMTTIESWFSDFVKGVSTNSEFMVGSNQRHLEYGGFVREQDKTCCEVSPKNDDIGHLPIKMPLNNRQQLKIQHQQIPVDRFEGVGLTARQFGTILHKILEQIDTIEDVPKAIRKIELQGLINQDRVGEIATMLNQAFADPRVKPWFDPNNRVIRERAIIGKNVALHRPDRIVITPEQVTHVIDYKFTHEESEAHKEQVRNYVNLLIKSGLTNVHGYVWYLLRKKVEVVG